MSLADVYNVEGSIAGIETLISKDVSLVHEMGATIFSERVDGEILTVASGDVTQSTSWDLEFPESAFTPGPFRILGVSVIADNGARIQRCQISIRSDLAIADGLEIPIWVWDSTSGIAATIRWVNNGQAVANESYLVGLGPLGMLPNMGFGLDSVHSTPMVACRGSASAFGAGTVAITAQLYIAQAQIRGLSSRGLPLPGW